MPKKNLIITGANTAKEINPFGHKPTHNDKTRFLRTGGEFQMLLEKWEEAEKYLKKYTIIGTPLDESLKKLEEIVGGKISHVNHGYVAGMVVTCEVNEETLEAIIL